ncbi:MAG: hypothetical protein NC311_11385 [Muribaculaceae bacterium]|nr:hypothetical protein [Muribaculaceae bacterium]
MATKEQLLTWELNFAKHTIKELEKKLEIKDLRINELREKLRSIRTEDKQCK